jgi:hypothetical protein
MKALADGLLLLDEEPGGGFWLMSQDFAKQLTDRGDFENHVQQIDDAFSARSRADIRKAVTSEPYRYLLGLWYAGSTEDAPVRDAHGEWVEKSELRDAVVKYIGKSSREGRKVHLQHDEYGSDAYLGQWQEFIALSRPVAAQLIHKGETHVHELPPGSIWMGATLNEPAWKAATVDGTITGWSIGGTARRTHGVGNVESARHMGWDVRKSATFDDLFYEVNAPIAEILGKVSRRLDALEKGAGLSGSRSTPTS